MKELYASDQSKFYREQVPDELTAEIAKVIYGSYRNAYALAEDRWGLREAKDALSIVRRADIETALTTLGAKFKGRGTSVRKMPNQNGTDWHTEVRAGAVVITVSKTEGPDVAVREAEFRKTLAADCRLNMPWAAKPPTPADDAETLWACIVHGPSDNPAVPSYIRVVFPLPDGTFQDHISITALATATKTGAAKPEEIAEAVTRLRRDAKRIEGAE